MGFFRAVQNGFTSARSFLGKAAPIVSAGAKIAGALAQATPQGRVIGAVAKGLNYADRGIQMAKTVTG
jgi:hypothetical protein